MTLSFTLQFPWRKQTDFVQKIWASVNDELIISKAGLKTHVATTKNGHHLIDFWKAFRASYYRPKHHSIRVKRKDRPWRTGDKLHFGIYSRQPRQVQFLPEMRVKRVEPISITWPEPIERDDVSLNMLAAPSTWPVIKIGEHVLPKSHHLTFAHNDGFDSQVDFWRFFAGKDLIDGQIIHWTDLNYDSLFKNR